jgi:hypothetical protein
VSGPLFAPDAWDRRAVHFPEVVCGDAKADNDDERSIAPCIMDGPCLCEEL